MVFDWQFRHQFVSGQRVFELDVSLQTNSTSVVLFGASGSGKTLTLKAVAGLLTPTEGHIIVNGRTLFDAAGSIQVPVRHRRMGLVFQDYALFPHLTVRQNIAFSLTSSWRNPRQDMVSSQLDHWLSVMGLEAVQHQWPHELSGGQQQRTALARALVAQPDALLLDEPFAALDHGLRQAMRDELRQLQQQLNLPLVLITHDPQDVEVFGQQVVHVRDGWVHADPAVR